MATPNKVAEQVARALYLYSSAEPSPERVQVLCMEWQRAFEFYDDEALEAAVTRCIDTSNFFPKVAELRAAIESIQAEWAAEDANYTSRRLRGDVEKEPAPMTPETRKLLDKFGEKLRERRARG